MFARFSEVAMAVNNDHRKAIIMFPGRGSDWHTQSR